MRRREVFSSVGREVFSSVGKEAVAVGAAVSLLQGEALAAEGECLHCLLVAINTTRAVCVVCRKVIEGPVEAGVLARFPGVAKG